jgi:molecular chaperone DnaJ
MQVTCPSCRGAGSVIKHPCESCNGEAFVLQQVRREVHIPAGVDSETRLRLEGEGEPSPNGGPRGDCYCFIEVREHELFQRNGQDLIVRVPISYPQASLGAEIEVPTLDGVEELTIPAGTQPAQTFRLRGRGMPDPRRRGKGDLLVQVQLEVPKRLSARHEELLRELADEEHSHVSPHRKTFVERLKDYFTGDSEQKVEG